MIDFSHMSKNRLKVLLLEKIFYIVSTLEMILDKLIQEYMIETIGCLHCKIHLKKKLKLLQSF